MTHVKLSKNMFLEEKKFEKQTKIATLVDL
jgi:hypothetical protein